MKKPTHKQIDAFLQGMEYAARINAQTPRGCQEALKVRRDAMVLKLNYERKFEHEKRV